MSGWVGLSEKLGLGSKPFNGVISEIEWNLCYIFIAHNVLYYIIIIQILLKHTNKQNKETNKKTGEDKHRFVFTMCCKHFFALPVRGKRVYPACGPVPLQEHIGGERLPPQKKTKPKTNNKNSPNNNRKESVFIILYRQKQKMMMMMKWCLMSSDVSWHIRAKLWPMPKHGSVILYVHGNQKAR